MIGSRLEMTSSPLLINEPPLQILPSLAQKIGLNEAIIVQQVHYWLNPKFNKNYFEGRYWVWNTYEQWQHQFPFWGMNTIRRAIGNLEESRILISFVTRDFKKLKYYSIDYDLLQNFVSGSKTEFKKATESLDTCPSAQNGQIDLLKTTDRKTQNGQADRPKMGCLYNKNTENTNSENTLHPSPSILKEEEDENVKKMLMTWNETVQKKLPAGKDVYSTQKRISALNTCFSEVFNNDQFAWKSYCEQISQSQFLMGDNPSGFKVTLDWALIIDNAYKILEGAIYDKPSPKDLKPKEISRVELLDEIRNKILKDPSQEVWFRISEHLIDCLGPTTYKSWFNQVTFTEIKNDIVTLQIEMKFIQDFIINNFLKDLKCAISEVFPSFKEIQFQLSPKKEP